MSAHVQPLGRIRLPASLRRFGGGGASRVRLVCFPWAGAGASVYRRLAAHVPPTIEVLAVQYPGREDRYPEPRAVRMEPLVDQVVGDLLPLAPRPLVLFGHSMGAFVAYEVARRLEDRGGPSPEVLVVSGSGSPDSPETFVRSAAAASDASFLDDLRALGGTPADVLASPQMVEVLLPVLRADYQVLDHYARQPAPPVSCRLVACASRADGSVTAETVRAWARHTSGPYEEHWFEGDHFYLNARPEELAQRLGRWAVAHRGVAEPGSPSGPQEASSEEANTGTR